MIQFIHNHKHFNVAMFKPLYYKGQGNECSMEGGLYNRDVNI